MSDKTPSPQSVAVPVEPSEAMLSVFARQWHMRDFPSERFDHATPAYVEACKNTMRECWSAMLAASPAPSSLAGGEITEAARQAFYEATEITSVGSVLRLDDGLRAAFAALSPEAPAREGATHPDAQPFERFPELALHIERMAMTGLVGSGISWDAFLRELNAALTPRHEAPASHAFEASHSVQREGGCKVCGHDEASHEAPAEGAGERERLADAYIAGAMSVHEYWTENPGEAPRGDPEFDEAAGDYAYSILSDLRARSSAPEPREEALGNLLAVIHGDGGHRALEVGVEQAAAEAEKIVAGLLAAPSADKLRIAVEALEGARDPLSTAKMWAKRKGGCDGALDKIDRALSGIKQALAVLKAEAK